MEKDKKEYKNCLFYSYGQFCNRFYREDKNKYGWADLTEYRCYKKCIYFRKKNWFNRFLLWLFFFR